MMVPLKRGDTLTGYLPIELLKLRFDIIVMRFISKQKLRQKNTSLGALHPPVGKWCAWDPPPGGIGNVWWDALRKHLAAGFTPCGRESVQPGPPFSRVGSQGLGGLPCKPVSGDGLSNPAAVVGSRCARGAGLADLAPAYKTNRQPNEKEKPKMKETNQKRNTEKCLLRCRKKRKKRCATSRSG